MIAEVMLSNILVNHTLSQPHRKPCVRRSPQYSRDRDGIEIGEELTKTILIREEKEKNNWKGSERRERPGRGK